MTVLRCFNEHIKGAYDLYVTSQPNQLNFSYDYNDTDLAPTRLDTGCPDSRHSAPDNMFHTCRYFRIEIHYSVLHTTGKSNEICGHSEAASIKSTSPT